VAARWAWSLPVLGAKLRLLALARLFRTLGMLLAAGVPAVAALKTARSVVAPSMRDALDMATQAVSGGMSLSAAFDAAGLATPVSSRMFRVGERSGALGQMLAQAAEFYDEELVRLGEFVTHLVNPLLMLLMGGLIGLIVVLLYMPIFQLAEQVS
jgi:general secretion pathway protein F